MCAERVKIEEEKARTPRVEPVGGKKHGEEQDDFWVGDKCVPQAHDLLLPRRLLGCLDPRAVRSDHLGRIRHEHRDCHTDQCKDEKTNIGAVLDSVGLVLNVLAEGNRSSNDSTEVEDGPEDRDEATFLAFGRVGKHQGALGGPEEAGTKAEDGSCGDDECLCSGMDIESSIVKGIRG